MSCVLSGFDVHASVEKLQSLLTMESHLDEEMDELERLYQLDQIKCDWLKAVGHPDLCDVIRQRMQKTDSLLNMYRPMLEETCAEKAAHIRIIMLLRNQQQLLSQRTQQDQQQEEHQQPHQQIGDHQQEQVHSSLEDNDPISRHQPYCNNSPHEQSQQHTYVSQQHYPFISSSPVNPITETKNLDTVPGNISSERANPADTQSFPLSQGDIKDNQDKADTRRRTMVSKRRSNKLKQLKKFRKSKFLNTYVITPRFHYTDTPPNSRSTAVRRVKRLPSSKQGLRSDSHSMKSGHGQGSRYLCHARSLHFRPISEPKRVLFTPKVCPLGQNLHDYIVKSNDKSHLLTKIHRHKDMDNSKSCRWLHKDNKYTCIFVMKNPLLFDTEVKTLDQSSIGNEEQQEIHTGSQHFSSPPTNSNLNLQIENAEENERETSSQSRSHEGNHSLFPPKYSEFFTFLSSEAEGRE